MNNIISYVPIACLLVLSGLIISSCTDNDKINPGLTATPTELIVAYTGFTQEEQKEINFVITCNSEWTITSDDEWITPNHASGKGTHTIYLKVGENGIEDDREGSVTVRSGDLSETVVVKQLKKVEELTVSPKEITVRKNGLLESGDKAAISMATNSSWTAESKVGWIKLSKEYGNELYPVITLDIEVGGSIQRESEIIIISGDLTESVKVTQLPQRLIVNPDNIAVNKHGFTQAGISPTLTVESDDPWQITYKPAWVQPNKMAGTRDEQILLAVEENGTGSLRDDKIAITSGSMYVEINISQTASNIIMTDDGKTVGYVYLNEDFNWITADYVNSAGNPIPDYISDFKESSTPTIANVLGVAGNAALKQKWETQGWTPYVKPGVTVSVYTIVGALKFGTSTRGGGIISPLLGIEANKFSNITLSFDLINNISVSDKDVSSPGYGTGTIDNPYVTLDIVGSGKFDDNTTRKDFNVDNVKWNDWQSKSAVIKGAGSDTQLIFCSQNMDNNTGKSRWYLDNIKVVKRSIVQ